MRVVLFTHDTEIVQVRSSAEPLELLVVDHDSGASTSHRATLDADGVREAFGEAGLPDIDLGGGIFVVVDRSRGGIVHLLSDTPNVQLLVRDEEGLAIPVWIGSVDPDRVADLFDTEQDTEG